MATEQMTGVEARQLFGVTIERSGVRFDVADTIITRIIGPSWWLEEPDRRRWYYGAERVFGGQAAAVKAAYRRRARELVAA